MDPMTHGLRWDHWLLALVLGGSFIIADREPIQIGPHFKVSITTTPLFLMAVLLPPALAGPMAMISVLSAEVLSRTKRLREPVEIAASSGRWGLVVFLGAVLLGLPFLSEAIYALQLILIAALMFSADVLSSALELRLLSKESFWESARLIAYQVAPVEAVQYVLGIIGGIAAREHTWVLVLLVFPVFVIYFAFKALKETRPLMEQTIKLLQAQYSTNT